MAKTFDLNHIILYSKNWYTRSDNFWDDIYKCLTTTWYINGKEHSYMMLRNEKESMYRVILNNYTESMHNDPHKIADLITGIAPSECWKHGYYTKDSPYKADEELPEYDYKEAVVRVILSQLSMWSTKNFPHLSAPVKECLSFEKDADKRFNDMKKSNLCKEFNL